jgi:DNA-binding transcriptional ArsR family regulator
MADVVLDAGTFKALSSETRIAIIKQLAERRKSASELAAALGIAAPSAAQHLERLREAKLVRRVDGGSKWVYYELTDKARALLETRRLPAASLIVVLVFALIALAAILNYGALQQQGAEGLGAKLGIAAPSLAAGDTRAAAPSEQGVAAPELTARDALESMKASSAAANATNATAVPPR